LVAFPTDEAAKPALQALSTFNEADHAERRSKSLLVAGKG
jgi:hypothetical protein